jgi:hypothetical protein
MGQLANHLGERDKRKLPSQPMTNPKAFMIGNFASQLRGHEQVQSIVTLRSGRQVNNKEVQEEEDSVVLQGKESGRDKGEKAEPSRVIPTVGDPPRSFIPKAPYAERLKAPKKNA